MKTWEETHLANDSTKSVCVIQEVHFVRHADDKTSENPWYYILFEFLKPSDRKLKVSISRCHPNVQTPKQLQT